MNDWLGGLLGRFRARSWPLAGGPRGEVTATTRPVGRPQNSIAVIRLQEAAALHAGRCFFDVKLAVVTDPGSGGYSAFVPVVLSTPRQEPVVFYCDLDVQEGAVGVCAATADGRIVAERVATGTQRRLEIIVPDPREVAGILIRNSAINGRPSRAIIESISAETYPTERILRIWQNRSSFTLRLPLRKQADGTLQDPGDSTTAIIDLDTRATAAIDIDAWQTHGNRVALNVCDKLAPTLAALRSTGLAILHAAHDQDIHPLVRPLAGETEIPGDFHDTDFIASMLGDAGIRNLIYLGYFSNKCILQRSLGMLEMHKKGFRTILVRDASLAIESEESVAGEWFHKAAVRFVELNFGESTTCAEVQAGVAAMTDHSHESSEDVTTAAAAAI
jgi:nicotinamidase-related amidase